MASLISLNMFVFLFLLEGLERKGWQCSSVNFDFLHHVPSSLQPDVDHTDKINIIYDLGTYTKMKVKV